MQVNTNLDPFAVIRREFERRLNHAASPQSCTSGQCQIPFSASREDRGLVLEFELPGIPMGEIGLEITDGILEVKADRPKPEHEMSRNERYFGTLARAVKLPDDVDPETVDAVLKNGILTVSLDERQGLKPKQIEIRTAS